MHTHSCVFCGQHYTCDAPMERNHDGWPDPVCVTRTEPNLDHQACPGCREHGACEDCGERPAMGESPNAFLCAECLHKWIDNYEPPEPDLNAVSWQEQYDAAAKQKRSLR